MSVLEEMLALHIRASKLPAPEREFRFCKRKWRIDFAYPDKKIAIECEGGIWNGGRHTRGAGFINDCDKYNELALMGWKVLRFTGNHIMSGTAIDIIIRAFDGV